jgi:ribose transport system substrate-binding protein
MSPTIPPARRRAGSPRARRAGLPLAALLAAAALAAAGCGASSSSGGGAQVKVDVGAGQPISVPKGKPKVAFFSWINNSYTRAYSTRVQQQAKAKGMSIDYFDSGGDPQKQFNQIQNAILRRTYNAFIVLPVDGKLECKPLSSMAPKAGIVVEVSVLPICNRDLNPATAAGQWQPGTLSSEGAENLVAYKVGWLREVQARLTGAKQIGIVAGVPLQGNWLSMQQALGQFPQIKSKVVAAAHTDFTTPQALAQTQTMLRAHPNVDLIISMASDITRGVVRALQSAGKAGKVKVVDLGGSADSVAQIKAGNLDFTVPYDPIGNADVAVGTVADAFAGKQVPRYVDDFPATRLGTQDQPLAIDKANVDSFRSQY